MKLSLLSIGLVASQAAAVSLPPKEGLLDKKPLDAVNTEVCSSYDNKTIWDGFQECSNLVVDALGRTSTTVTGPKIVPENHKHFLRTVAFIFENIKHDAVTCSQPANCYQHEFQLKIPGIQYKRGEYTAELSQAKICPVALDWNQRIACGVGIDFLINAAAAIAPNYLKLQQEQGDLERDEKDPRDKSSMVPTPNEFKSYISCEYEMVEPKGEEPKGEEPKGEEPEGEKPDWEEPEYGTEEPDWEEPEYGTEEPEWEEPEYEMVEPKGEEPEGEEPKGEKPDWEEPEYGTEEPDWEEVKKRVEISLQGIKPQ